MMLRFDNFKATLPPEILKRGRDYYRNHHISDLSFDDEAEWTAQVEGTETYDVVITQQPGGDLTWDCTCPYAESAACKHIAAVLYAIEADYSDAIGRKKPASNAKRKPTKADLLRQALIEMPHDALVKLLVDWAAAERAMMDQLMLRVGAKGSQPADYVTMVKAALRVGKGDYGYMDYAGVRRVARELEMLIAQAKQKLHDGQPLVAIAIMRAIIETMGEPFQSMDDSSGSMFETILKALETLKRAAQHPLVTDAARRDLLDVFIAYATTSYLVDYDNDGTAWETAAALVTPAERDMFMRLLKDKTIKPRTGRASYESERGMIDADFAAELELSIIKRLDGAAAAARYEDANDHLDSIRIKRVEEAIETGDYETAARYIGEAKKQRPAQPKIDPREFLDVYGHEFVLVQSVDVYDTLALKLAEKRRDTPQIIALARTLWQATFSEQYYRLIRRHVAGSQWAAMVETLVRDAIHAFPRQAWIYHEEQRWEDLLKLVQKHPHLLHGHYQTALEAHFPDVMIRFYESRILDSLKNNANTKTYSMAAVLLERMKTLGAGEKVAQIVVLLRATYPRRKALMDELKQF